MPHLVVAADKFRGTATAAEVGEAAAVAARSAGWRVSVVPLADGGEGTLAAFGGPNRFTEVAGPLGSHVTAGWRLSGGVAVIEMALASGIDLVGGAAGNDPLEASTRGTGELIDAALRAGAREVIVGLGGSATTDGGWGAVEAINRARLAGVRLRAACDVRIGFVDAARCFAAQKGASAAQVMLLERRLEGLARTYRSDFGVDVLDLPGAGAAGGLGGGLAAVGASLESGFELVAEHLHLDHLLATADLVITGEGAIDDESFDGKVVGGVAEWCAEFDVPCLAIGGSVHGTEPVPVPLTVVNLAEEFGPRGVADVLGCVEEITHEALECMVPSVD
jgi:glycerate kinase